MEQRPLPREASSRARATSYRMMEDDHTEVEERASVGFDITEIVDSRKFPSGNVERTSSSAFSLTSMVTTGFRNPMLFEEHRHLGLVVPDPTFTVSDVERLVGSNRVLDVMDCSTQEALAMKMRDWTIYYNDPDKKRLLNVISLEFSQSKLTRLVTAPSLVRQIDLIDNVWPSELKAAQQSATNDMELMMYPKVQKYCLMSVGGCYTDWHIDFGGTSVWYHVLRGSKVFFLAPPSDTNILSFEKWSKGEQEGTFFGDMCSDCTMVTLVAGNTFMIPTGWIHAVYTPEDSLVFGGNFVHGFNVEGQFQIAKLENRLRVPQRYRFPFYEELMWYYAIWLKKRLECGGLKLSTFEISGAQALIAQLQVWGASPLHTKRIPEAIDDSDLLLDDLSALLAGNFKQKHKHRSSMFRSTHVGVVEGRGMKKNASKSEIDLTDEAHGARYSQLKRVREGLLRCNIGASEDDITAAALRRWATLSKPAKQAFHELFSNPKLLASALSGEVDEDVESPARTSKYERKRYLAPLDMVEKAKAAHKMKENDKQYSSLEKRDSLRKAPSVPTSASYLKAESVSVEMPIGKAGCVPTNTSVVSSKHAESDPRTNEKFELDSILQAIGRKNVDTMYGRNQSSEAKKVNVKRDAAVKQQARAEPMTETLSKLKSAAEVDSEAAATAQTESFFGYPSADAPPLSHITALQPRDLDLSWSTIDDSQLSVLLKSLKLTVSLNMTGCTKLQYPGFILAGSGLALSSINLNFVGSVNEVTLSCLHVFSTTLKELHLAGANVGDQVLSDTLSILPRLQILDVYGCERITDAAFRQALTVCPALRDLDVRGTLATGWLT